MQFLRTFALVTLVLGGCDEESPDFVDAGRDASIDATPAPAGMLPLSIPLAITDCGATSQQTFQVVNTGSADLTYSLALSDAAFTVTPSSGTIIAGASTTFTVGVTVPQSATAGTVLTATLTATTNLPGSPHSVPVTVTPRGAHITITPPSVGFGQVEAGTTSGAMTSLVANTGNAPATVTIAAPGGEFDRIFGTNGTLTLAGSQSADASFTYAPTGIGADSGAAAVTITGVHCGTAPTSITLSGSGEVTGGVLVGGTPVAFGATSCNSSSSTANVTLTNTAEIAASFTASFLTDAEGDDARYAVSPANGTIPANSMVTLTVTRMHIPLPFQPRAIDATLRVNVNLPLSTNTDVAVTQTLTGPFLTANPTTQDFGFANVGGSRTGPVTINNTGNATATLQSQTTPSFSFALPAMVNPGSSGAGTMTFAPTELGLVSAGAVVTAAGACSIAVPFSFTAGRGPLAGISTSGSSFSCPSPSQLTGDLAVSNQGNQPLNAVCVDVNAATNDFAFAVQGLPITVPAGGSGAWQVTLAPPSPVRAGSATTTVRCTTNEPLGNVYDLSYVRALNGADLQLSSAAALDFTCFITDRRFYTITSAATSNQSVFVSPGEILAGPLGHDFTQPTLGPGAAYQNSVTTYGGGSGQAFQGLFGVPQDPCQIPAAPGTVVFTGDVHVGSGSGVCSVTPSSLPVVLRAGTLVAN